MASRRAVRGRCALRRHWTAVDPAQHFGQPSALGVAEFGRRARLARPLRRGEPPPLRLDPAPRLRPTARAKFDRLREQVNRDRIGAHSAAPLTTLCNNLIRCVGGHRMSPSKTGQPRLSVEYAREPEQLFFNFVELPGPLGSDQCLPLRHQLNGIDRDRIGPTNAGRRHSCSKSIAGSPTLSDTNRSMSRTLGVRPRPAT